MIQYQIEYKEELFYLYCVLIYNNYKNIHFEGTPTLTTKHIGDRVIKIMREEGVAKYNLHKYVYRKSSEYIEEMLTSEDYEPTIETDPKFYDTLTYTKKVATIDKLQKQWAELKTTLAKDTHRIQSLCNKCVKITNKYLAFEPYAKPLLVTKAFSPFNITLYGKDRATILLGVEQKTPENNLLHEFIHLYIHNITVEPSTNLKKIIAKVHPKLLEIYNTSENVIKESLVRALTIHISRLEKDLEDIRLSNDDRGLVLPEIYLSNLQKTNIKKPLSKKNLQSIITKAEI